MFYPFKHKVFSILFFIVFALLTSSANAAVPVAPVLTIPPHNPTFAVTADSPTAGSINFQWSYSGDPTNIWFYFYLLRWNGSAWINDSTITNSAKYINGKTNTLNLPEGFYAWEVAAVDITQTASPWYKWSPSWNYLRVKPFMPSPSPIPTPTPTPNASYTILKTSSAPVIDGIISEFFNANPLTFSGGNGTVTFRMMWDSNNLYISGNIPDNILTANNTIRDTALYNDDSIEFIFDTLNNKGTNLLADDYKIIINALNAVYDRRGSDTTWNGPYTYAVKTNGTVNVPTDTDINWTFEIALPWSSLSMTPVANIPYGMNFASNDNDNGTRATYFLNGTSVNVPDNTKGVILSNNFISASTPSPTPSPSPSPSPSLSPTPSPTYSATPTPASGPTFYISPAGSDSNPGTSVAPWKTWAFALKQLDPGETLIAKKGTWTDFSSCDEVSGVAGYQSPCLADTRVPIINCGLPLYEQPLHSLACRI